MDELRTKSVIIRDVTTTPNIFEVKGSEQWAVGDFTDPKRKHDVSVIHRGFWKGNYSYSLLSVERNKEIVPVAVFHQENIDPCLLVESWLDPTHLSCSAALTPRTRSSDWINYEYAGNTIKVPEWAGKNRTVPWKEDHAVENRTELEKVDAANFNGRFYFVKHSKFLFAKASDLKLSVSQKGIYKMQMDNETIGVAIDPIDVFGDAELSSTLFDDTFSRYGALALHKTASDLHEPEGGIPIESGLYGNTYRSFYKDGNHTGNTYWFDSTMDRVDFSLLPDTVFVKILLYVPWTQRILSRRVNRRWMKLCNVAISIDTKIISRNNQQFEHMDEDDVWRLLPIVSNRLEEIEWLGLCNTQRLIEMLLEMPAFPNLRIIDMGDEKPDYVTFFLLLDKCPNLRELTAVVPTSSLTRYYYPGTYQVTKLILPNDWEVKIDDSYLVEIINHFPNLIYLRFHYDYVTAAGLSLVIGKYGENLVHLQMRCVRGLKSNAGITGIEKCQNLEYLELTSADFLSDAFMKDVANGCQKLRTLDITGCNKVTNEGLAALASLQNLKQLNVSSIVKDLCLGVSLIAKQGRLEQLIAKHIDLSVTCLKDCVRYCRQLKLLDTSWTRTANRVALEDAKEIIHLFNGCSLSPRLLFRTDCKVWTKYGIKRLREELKESGQRRFIVHYVCHDHDPVFIRDDESISSHESTESDEDWDGYHGDDDFPPYGGITSDEDEYANYDDRYDYDRYHRYY